MMVIVSKGKEFKINEDNNHHHLKSIIHIQPVISKQQQTELVNFYTINFQKKKSHHLFQSIVPKVKFTKLQANFKVLMALRIPCIFVNILVKIWRTSFK